MPGWLKALLIVVIVVVVLIVGVVGIGAFYIYRHKDAWMAGAKEVANEGKNFGSGTDNQGCVDESLSRYKKEPGLIAIFSNSVFMRTCLDSSKPTPGFCDEVPRTTEFMKSAEWRKNQCRLAGLQSDNQCQNLFAPVQQFCEAPYKRSRDNNANDAK